MADRASSTPTWDTSDYHNTCVWSYNTYNCITGLEGFDWILKERHECLDPHQEILHSAIINSNIEEVRNLLKQGLNINQRDCRGWSPLHHALTSEYGVYMSWPNDSDSKIRKIKTLQVAKQIIELIMETEPDVKQQDFGGRGSLHIAALSGDKDYVRALLDRGANAEQTDHDGRTPLHYACLSYNSDPFAVTRILLDHGVDVNVLDSRGATPLQYLYGRGFCSTLVKLLLDAGASLEIGQTILTNLHDCYYSVDEMRCIDCPMLRQHLYQNLALGLHIDPDIKMQLKQIQGNGGNCDLHKLFEEVERMKRCYLFESTTLFDIFLREKCEYRSNRELVQNLDFEDCVEFPEYKSRLKAKLIKDKIRYELHYRARESLLGLREASSSNFLQLLPDELCDKILHHLSIAELKYLLSCCEKLNK